MLLRLLSTVFALSTFSSQQRRCKQRGLPRLRTRNVRKHRVRAYLARCIALRATRRLLSRRILLILHLRRAISHDTVPRRATPRHPRSPVSEHNGLKLYNSDQRASSLSCDRIRAESKDGSNPHPIDYAVGSSKSIPFSLVISTTKSFEETFKNEGKRTSTSSAKNAIAIAYRESSFGYRMRNKLRKRFEQEVRLARYCRATPFRRFSYLATRAYRIPVISIQIVR